MRQLNVTDEYYYYSHCGDVIAIKRNCSNMQAYRLAIRKASNINKRFKMDTGGPKWNRYGDV